MDNNTCTKKGWTLAIFFTKDLGPPIRTQIVWFKLGAFHKLHLMIYSQRDVTSWVCFRFVTDLQLVCGHHNIRHCIHTGSLLLNTPGQYKCNTEFWNEENQKALVLVLDFHLGIIKSLKSYEFWKKVFDLYNVLILNLVEHYSSMCCIFLFIIKE